MNSFTEFSAYIGSVTKHGYYKSPYEIEAYDLQDKIEKELIKRGLCP